MFFHFLLVISILSVKVSPNKLNAHGRTCLLWIHRWKQYVLFLLPHVFTGFPGPILMGQTIQLPASKQCRTAHSQAVRETHFYEGSVLAAMLIQVEFMNSTSTVFQTIICKVTIMLSFKEMVLINIICFNLLFCIKFLCFFILFLYWLIDCLGFGKAKSCFIDTVVLSFIKN